MSQQTHTPQKTEEIKKLTSPDGTISPGEPNKINDPQNTVKNTVISNGHGPNKEVQIKLSSNEIETSVVTSAKESLEKETTQQMDKDSQNSKEQIQTKERIHKNDEENSEDDSKRHDKVPRQKRIHKDRKRSTSAQRRKYQQAKIHYEYQKDPTYFKTKLCPMFKNGTCNRGSKCSFAHGLGELRELPNYRKTRLCIAFTQGKCNLGSKDCKYAHGQEDMKKSSNNNYGNNNFNADKNHHRREQKGYGREHRDQRDDYRDQRDRERQRERDRDRDYKERNRDHRDYERGRDKNKNKERDQNAKYNQEIMKKYKFNPVPEMFPNPMGGINHYPPISSYPQNPYGTSTMPYVQSSRGDFQYPTSSTSWPYPPASSGLVPSVTPSSMIPQQYPRYESNITTPYNPPLPYYAGSYAGQSVSSFSKPFSS